MKKLFAKFSPHKKKILYVFIFLIVLSSYPCFILGYTWFNVGTVDLEGGTNGPRDAYRHILASAIVSYTIGDWAVNIVTNITEEPDKLSSKMDIHNNKIGKKIGRQMNSFFDIEPMVKQAVLNGEVNTKDEDRVTWLPKKTWQNRWLF